MIVVAWPVVDLIIGRNTFPGGLIASVLELPDAEAAGSLLGWAAAVAGAVYVWRTAASIDLEAAARRATRSRSLLLALELGDPAAAILVRQDLAGEQPRSAPWVALRSGWPSVLGPFGRRHLRSILRWPSGRLVRTLVLCVASGTAFFFMADDRAVLLPVTAVLLCLAMLEFGEPLLQQITVERHTDAVRPHAEVLRGLLGPLSVWLVGVTLLGVVVPLVGSSGREAWSFSPLLVAAGVAAVIAALLPSPINFVWAITKSAGLYTWALIFRMTAPLVPLLFALAPFTTVRLPVPRADARSGDLEWTLAIVRADLACAAAVVVSLALAIGWLTLHGHQATPAPRST